MDSLQARPENARSKSAGVLQSLVLPKHRNRMSREITRDQALSVRNGNVQGAPILPPDHPHSKAAGTENVAPVNTDDGRSRKEKRDEGRSLHKRSKSAVSLRSLVGGGDDKKSRNKNEQEQSPEKKPRKSKKPVKTKSSTGLSAMFAKMNRSNKDLSKPVEDQENLSPPSPATGSAETPIFSQYATQEMSRDPLKNPRVRPDVTDEKLRSVKNQIDLYTPKEYSPSKREFGDARPTLTRPSSSSRPKSAILTGSYKMSDIFGRNYSADRSQLGSGGSDSSRASVKATDNQVDRQKLERINTDRSTISSRKISNGSAEIAPARGLTLAKRGTRVMAAVAALTGKTEDQIVNESKPLNPEAVNTAFESVLEARNIPEDQRQKMRSLTLHVKAEFVRQDKGASRPNSPQKASTWSQSVDSDTQEPVRTSTDEQDGDELDKKNATKSSRPRSRTFTFTKGDSPTKKSKAAGSRPNSIYGADQSTPSTPVQSPEKRSSWGRGGPKPAIPEDFVAYLRKEQNPVETEVGRLHKLRILLRNETVDWVNSFIELGGMAEIVGLLHRIMAIEWREEHEDQLLHETLLCLKGLCTTNAALQHLASIASTLFPKLLAMIFDEEKKGPAEFTTRGVIVWILFAHLNSASRSTPEQLSARATEILSYLADPAKPTDEQPLDFVLSMREHRPYRVWAKEVTNVSREVFWIFLHHLNVVPLPSTAEPLLTDFASPTTPTTYDAPGPNLSSSFTSRHFPTTRPPIPAAPYIGGVEWDATTYITTHLDLLNGLIASLPTAAGRNALRADLKASGWEKTMGGTLRLCKEKFYMPVHDALRVWVGAACEDGWDVRFVREGPNREERERASPKKSSSPVKKKEEAPPKLEMPKLDLGPSTTTDDFVF